MTAHICPYCLASFDGRKNKKFCNRSHAELWHRKQEYREPRKVTPNMTGRCLNCDAPVEIPRLYCSKGCGNRYRQRRYDRAKHARPAPKPTSHVCVYTDGVCVKCVNERRKETYKKNKKYYLNVGFAHRASFATAGD